MMLSIYQMLRLPLLYLQTLVAVWLLASPLRKRPHFALRWTLIPLLACVICYFDSKLLYFPMGGMEYSLPRTLCMLVMYFLVIATVYGTYQVSWWTALFTASASYAAQNVAGSVKGVLKLIPTGADFANTVLYEISLDLVCYGGVYLLLYLFFRSSVDRSEESYDNHLKAVFSFVVLLLCIGMSRITQDNTNRDVLSQLAENIYAIISGILVLQVQFGTLENHHLTRDMDTMRELIHQQHTQFQASKESAQLVQEKYHDLKQMIGTLSDHISQRELEQLQTSLGQYDAIAQTGNQVLDVILTEKKMLCQKEQIHITCMAGGVELGFMEELDLYSLLSNALTNAIEAVTKLPKETERYITLTIQQEGGMTFFHVENPFAGEVSFEQGLPKSNRDSRYHGFGMKSMERTAQKYNGTLTAMASDGIFYLDVVLVQG
jgi:hypothetical protein